jgi:hypothetical protein
MELARRQCSRSSLKQQLRKTNQRRIWNPMARDLSAFFGLGAASRFLDSMRSPGNGINQNFR